jgi:hypothetical protein
MPSGSFCEICLSRVLLTRLVTLSAVFRVVLVRHCPLPDARLSGIQVEVSEDVLEPLLARIDLLLLLGRLLLDLELALGTAGLRLGLLLRPCGLSLGLLLGPGGLSLLLLLLPLALPGDRPAHLASLPGPGGLPLLHPPLPVVLAGDLPLDLAILSGRDTTLPGVQEELGLPHGHLSHRDVHLSDRAGGVSRQREAV